jgi:hypothetical protein
MSGHVGGICRWAESDELKPGAALRREGRFLYRVAVGTTWRFAWAPTIGQVRAFVDHSLYGRRQRTVPEILVRRAHASDLLLLADAVGSVAR